MSLIFHIFKMGILIYRAVMRIKYDNACKIFGRMPGT